VASSPLRPFVPHRTPKSGRVATSSSEFRLARPYVPGAERQEAEPIQREVTRESEPQIAGSLESIEDYLHTPAPTPGLVPVARESNVTEFDVGFDEASAELPPVEHFLDPLPPVEAFEREGANPFDDSNAVGDVDIAARVIEPNSLAAEWANTDWQQYDWRSLASLGEGAEAAASTEWASTDWDANKPRAKDVHPTAAQAIASALDQIAQRIRDGELAPMPGMPTDPATIAATLAAILGIRS
jgi:hypothetical protein